MPRSRLSLFLIPCVAVLLLLWGWQLPDPHLSPLRPLHVPGLFLGCALLAWFCLRGPGTLRMFGLGAALLAAGAGSVHQVNGWAVQRRLAQDDTAAMRQVGRHFVVGYRDVEVLKPLVACGLVGGIFLTRRNVVGKSAQQIEAEIAQLQALRRAAGLPLLLVTTDQEGGPVSRLTPPLAYQPALATLLDTEAEAARVDGSVDALARAYGEQQGRALAQLGVNVNFSPVVDLRGAPTTLLPDLHTRIDSRAISEDPARTIAVARAYGAGLAAQGVTPTLKHFPGLGRVAGDTHHFPATLDVPVNELEARDWQPFRTLGPQLDAWIMLAHVKVAAVDAQLPASFSAPVVDGLIRRRWGFDGVLITDDLSMGGAYLHGLCNAVVRGLNAGVDLLLIAYDDQLIAPALDCAARAQRRGQIDAGKLAASDARLERDARVRARKVQQ